MSKILKVVGASWLQTKVSSYILGLLGVLAILALFLGQMERIQEDGTYAATVFYSEKTGYRIEYWGQSNDLASIPRGVARAYFRMDVDTTGWSILEVETEGSYPDEIQAYAAGIVEGAITWYLIHIHLENTIRAKCENQPLKKQCDKLRDALDQSVNIWKNYASENEDSDPFWHHVSLYYTQIDGIYTGWKYGVERSMNEYETDVSDLYWLNYMSEVTEIQHKLNISLENDIVDKLPSMSSAFIRIVNETQADGKTTEKLFVSHNAAGSYSSMTRILKRYRLNYHLTAQEYAPSPGLSVDYSGYPGSVTSQDEFYILKGKDHRMAVTGTPLRNYNDKIWKDVNINEQLPVGPRVFAANHLASNVSSWGHLISAHNSGTGCKQWMVADFTKLNTITQHPSENVISKKQRKEVFIERTIDNSYRHTVVHHPSSGHARGLLWLVEQVPGRTHSADISDALLARHYAALYGLPTFQDISEITHTNKMEERYGPIFSESQTPRSVIFKRGYKNATSLESIIKLMRQNNMTAINLAKNEVDKCGDEIACVLAEEGLWTIPGIRGDIVKNFKEPYGIIDNKVVSGNSMDSTLEFSALSGPPYTGPTPNATNTTDVPLNKGNIASIYTDQFDNEKTINGMEIRDLVKHQQEEAQREELEKNIIKPFQWSASDFKDDTHEGLPDKWAFEPFKPNWSW